MEYTAIRMPDLRMYPSTAVPDMALEAAFRVHAIIGDMADTVMVTGGKGGLLITTEVARVRRVRRMHQDGEKSP